MKKSIMNCREHDRIVYSYRIARHGEFAGHPYPTEVDARQLAVRRKNPFAQQPSHDKDIERGHAEPIKMEVVLGKDSVFDFEQFTPDWGGSEEPGDFLPGSRAGTR